MRHPPRWEMRIDSTALHAEQSRIPNQTCKEPWFSWWKTRESPGSLSQNEINTDAPQECKIARCTPNQLKMKPIYLHWLHSYHMFHRIQYKWLDFLEETTEILWDPRLKSIWIFISAQQLEESSMNHISSHDESWFPVWLKRWASFLQAPQVEFSLRNR